MRGALPAAAIISGRGTVSQPPCGLADQNLVEAEALRVLDELHGRARRRGVGFSPGG